MKDDVDRMMDDAFGALRDETQDPEENDRTRARLLESHRAAGARTWSAGPLLAAAVALIAVLGGSVAWAYFDGRFDPEAPSEVEVPAVAPQPEARPARPGIAAPEPAVEPPLALPPQIVIEVARAPAAPIALAAEEPAIDEPTSDGVTPIDPAEHRAYREAHALHFETRDADAAIGAWESYLATYPRGRFALEARYNRALCLVRSGREAEAREALAPFVRGTHRGYRQREASEILEALAQE